MLWLAGRSTHVPRNIRKYTASGVSLIIELDTDRICSADDLLAYETHNYILQFTNTSKWYIASIAYFLLSRTKPTLSFLINFKNKVTRTMLSLKVQCTFDIYF